MHRHRQIFRCFLFHNNIRKSDIYRLIHNSVFNLKWNYKRVRVVSFVKPDKNFTEEYIFSTNVSADTTDDDFYVEFYPYCENMNCEGKPVKVTHTFDELLDFLEEVGGFN